MRKLGEELSKTNKNHDFLANLCGSWTTSTVTMGLPPDSGKATFKMIYGGRFLEGDHTGILMGFPFESKLLMGYDNYKHKFSATFIDNLGTSMRNSEGVLDKKRTTLILWGTMDEWVSDEHDKPVMYVYKIIDNNHFVFAIHDLSIIGGDTNVITVNYTRVKECL